MDKYLSLILNNKSTVLMTILIIVIFVILKKYVFKNKEGKKGLLSSSTLFIIYSIGFFLLFCFCFFYSINKYAYGKPTTNVLPHKVILDLWKIYSHTRNYELKTDIFQNFAMKVFVPIAAYIFLGLAVFFGNKKYRTENNERETIKGSAKWAEKKDLEKAGYLIPMRDVITQKTVPELMKDHKEPLSIILGQYNDAEIDASNPQRMRTKKWSKYIAGANIRKFNTLTIGGIGSGKGAGTICPTLLTFPDSVICYDPAKENFNVTAGYRQSIGYVQYFDPSDPGSTLHFNPFNWIRRNESYITVDIGNMSQIIIPTNPEAKDKFWDNTARDMLSLFIGYVLLFSPKEEQNLKTVTEISQKADYNRNPFLYKNMKKRLAELNDIIAENTENPNYIKTIKKEHEWLEKETTDLEEEQKEKEEMIKKLEEMTPSEKNKYRDKLRQKTRLEKQKEKEEEQEEEDEKGMFCLLDTILNDVEYKLKFFTSSKNNEWQKTLLKYCKATVSNIKINAKAEQTIASTFTTMYTYLSFFGEQTIANLMNDTSFTTDDLMRKTKPLSIYLCIKNADTERCKPFVKLFISCIINQLTDDYTLPYIHHLLFILDEFPQLGYMKNVEFAMPFVRKYHISFMLIIQSISQLEDQSAYGKDKTKSILDNTRVLDIKQVSQEETAAWISKRLGNRTVILDNDSHSYKTGGGSTGGSQSIKEESRALMNPTEIMEMEPHSQLMVISSSRSAIVKKFQYFEHSVFRERAAMDFDLSLPITEDNEKDMYQKEAEKKTKEIFKQQNNIKADKLGNDILDSQKTENIEQIEKKLFQKKEQETPKYELPPLEEIDGEKHGKTDENNISPEEPETAKKENLERLENPNNEIPDEPQDELPDPEDIQPPEDDDLPVNYE